ncbi:MAG: SRPBCC domain-containing protein [Roseiarcus sp.]
MNEQIAAMRSIVVERVMPHPPDKIWRALTEAHLIEQWLMTNDFEPRLGAEFMFRAKPMGDWDGTVRCAVTAFDPPRRLAYAWKGGSVSNSTYGSALNSVVEWLLFPDARPNGAFGLRAAERNGL